MMSTANFSNTSLITQRQAMSFNKPADSARLGGRCRGKGSVEVSR